MEKNNMGSSFMRETALPISSMVVGIYVPNIADK